MNARVKAGLERRLLWISLALGLMVLVAVPLHSALRADPGVLEHEDYLGPACETPLKVFPEPLCPKVVAGESPAVLAFALVAVPLALRRGGRGAMLLVTIGSLAFAALQLVAPLAVAFDPVGATREPSPFEADADCGLVNCGLDHTLFHAVQVPFLLAMALTGYRWIREDHADPGQNTSMRSPSGSKTKNA